MQVRSRSTRGVVLGAGIAGMLTAAVLVHHFDEVVIVERDSLPQIPGFRPGLPQGRHVHVLVSGGARALESLLPGVLDRLYESGAHRIGLPNDMLALTSAGWWNRFQSEMQFMVGCTRSLLDWTIKDAVMSLGNVSITTGTAAGLLGDKNRVVGVLVRERQDQHEYELEADLVVDTTGRQSQAIDWLQKLGFPRAPEKIVDAGLAYASRLVKAPSDAPARFPQIVIQPVPGTGMAGVGATMLPVEQGHWMITLSGTRGAEPPTDETGFASFARRLPHPIIADLLEVAEPAGRIHGFRATANRRRYYEKVPWPEGFLALGDSVCTFNPVYGHGMSVAARCAVILDESLTRYSAKSIAAKKPGTARRIQKNIIRGVRGAWTMATAQDARYPNTVGGSGVHTFQERYVDRVLRASTTKPTVANAVLSAFTLSGSFANLVAPSVFLASMAKLPPPKIGQPPATKAEWHIVRSTSA